MMKKSLKVGTNHAITVSWTVFRWCAAFCVICTAFFRTYETAEKVEGGEGGSQNKCSPTGAGKPRVGVRIRSPVGQRTPHKQTTQQHDCGGYEHPGAFDQKQVGHSQHNQNTQQDIVTGALCPVEELRQRSVEIEEAPIEGE